MRGNLPRTQIKIKEKEREYSISIISLKIPILKYLMKRIALNNLITKIFKYSAIKIKAKVALLYSVLNPETSSDSPSAKSKGVRLVSAKVVVNQIINKGKHKKTTPTYLKSKIPIKFKEPSINKQLNKIKAILTS